MLPPFRDTSGKCIFVVGVRTSPDKKQSRYWMLPALVLLIVLAFEPVRHNDFVSFDDYDYITKNHIIQEGLTWSSIRWAFTAGYASNWHPLTWLSHMIDIELFGLNPIGHHLHNVLLHTAASVVLFFVFLKMLGSSQIAFWIVLAFSIHPLRVESVAWASERKDVLSMFFFSLTLACYLSYRSKPNGYRYLLIVVCLALGLMAKPMLVTVPLLLLLLDYWPLRRLSRTSLFFLLLEKSPLFLMVLASSIITYLVQKEAGSVSPIPLPIRLANAVNSYTGYLSKNFLPIDLAFFYPFPDKIPWIFVIFSVLALIFWTGLCVHQRHTHPWLLIGWLWYLFALVPVIGLIQVGSQSMADRYTYLPSIGIFLSLVCEAKERLAVRPSLKPAVLVMCAAAVTGMVFASRKQTLCWKNSITLYECALKADENNYLAHGNLGAALLEEKRYEEAAVHLSRALAQRPNLAEANADMALLSLLQNQPQKSLEYARTALRHAARNHRLYYNIGLIMEQTGNLEEAMYAYRQAVHCHSYYYPAFSRIGLIQEKRGLYEEAYVYYLKSIQSNRNYADGYKNLAWLLATNPAFEDHNPAETVRYAQKACELTQYSKAEMLDVLAAAYANAREFDKAVQTAQKAVELARAAGRENLVDDIIRRKSLYENKLPFRKTLPTETAEPLAEPSSL